MTYELAKKLKDAGFPQKDGAPRDRYISDHPLHKYCYTPTLSELIEACGGQFGALRLGAEHKWLAWGDEGIEEWGNTPSEAVANLWLELNKK